MTYEAWRISYQDSEQAARAAYRRAEELAAKLAELERQEPVNARLVEALSKRCYTLSEGHWSGYRVVLGFETLDEAHCAHEEISKAHTSFAAEAEKNNDRAAGGSHEHT